MRFRMAAKPLAWLATLLALAPAPLAAQAWEEVAQVPGGIALELDRNSTAKALDGSRSVMMGIFRKQLPTGTMETTVAVDCAAQEAKIRRIRLIDGPRLISDNIMADAGFTPIREGSAEDLYRAALCQDAESAAQ